MSQRLRQFGISCRVDDSGASIGKRYARNDELGIPLGITIDFDTIKDDSITLRERNSMKQVRASISDIVQSIKSLVDNQEVWDDIINRLLEFIIQGGEDRNFAIWVEMFIHHVPHCAAKDIGLIHGR